MGTFILVLFGCGSVATTILFDAHKGLMQVAIAWGMGVTLAIYATRHLSGAHLNPAVSCAMVVAGRLSSRRLGLYVGAQLTGAVLGALTLYGLFGPSIGVYEATHRIVRGSPESVRTASMFGEFYASPGSHALVTLPLAMVAEALGAFLLVLLVLALTESANEGRPDGPFAPVLIGATITSIVCLIAPLTQCGINPARDFGPRLVSYLMGWGSAALPDNVGGFFFVYVLSPIIGGCLAAVFFVRILEPAMLADRLKGDRP